jgi:hypothetical protein
MNITSPVTLTYAMVRNDTNDTNDNYKLPDFLTTINSANYNGTVNAKETWTNSTDIIDNFQAICDNEDLNIFKVYSHPKYDLSLMNEPSGMVSIGTWIKSTATAINGNPLSTDYVAFKVTPPSGNIISKNVNFSGSNSCSFNWQLNEKGQYLVEVWAYDQNGEHVKVPDSQSALRSLFSTPSKGDSNFIPNSQITHSQEIIDVE